jgi:hypothetical protein
VAVAVSDHVAHPVMPIASMLASRDDDDAPACLDGHYQARSVTPLPDRCDDATLADREQCS